MKAEHMQRGWQVILDYHDHVELDGMAYPIINNHRNYIVALKILRNKNILMEDKVETVLPLLYVDEIPKGTEAQAIYAYFDLFNDKKPKDNRPITFDIVQDSQYIFAGFMQTYGIDLDECEPMKIEKFIALVKGLPSNTRLADVIKIRTTPIPLATKNNAKQIADIIRAKAEVALENNDSLGKSMQSFGKFVQEWARHGR